MKQNEGHVSLVICLNEIHRIFFQNSLFFICLFKRFPLSFQLRWKNCSLSIYRYLYGSTILLFFCFLSSNNYHYLFSIAQFLNKIVKPKCKTSFGKLLRPTLYCKIFSELNLIELSKQKCDTCKIQIDVNLYTKSYLRDLKGF